MTAISDIDDRISKCQRILQGDPSSQIFAALADAHRKKGEVGKAFNICQNGLKIHDKYGSAHVVMAKINLDRGLYDWAEAEANKAAELDGRTRTVELLLAEIHIYKGEFKEAVTLLSRLHEADPDNSQIEKLLEIARKIPEEQTIVQNAQMAAITDPQQSAELTPTPAQAPNVEPDESNLGEILAHAVAIPGVDGALLVNDEGLVVESEWCLPTDHHQFGAALGEVGHWLEKELIENSFGSIDTVLVETEAQTFYMVKAIEGTFLFVGNSSASLGSLRMRLEKLLRNYRP